MKGEDNGRIQTKIEEILSSAGFTVSKNNSFYTLIADMKLEYSGQGDIINSFPQISIRIERHGKVLASYSKNYGRISAYEKQSCERLSLHKMELDLQKNFLSECLKGN